MYGKNLGSWDEVAEEEDSHDRNLLIDCDFSHAGLANRNFSIDSKKKEIK